MISFIFNLTQHIHSNHICGIMFYNAILELKIIDTSVECAGITWRAYELTIYIN